MCSTTRPGPNGPARPSSRPLQAPRETPPGRSARPRWRCRPRRLPHLARRQGPVGGVQVPASMCGAGRAGRRPPPAGAGREPGRSRRRSASAPPQSRHRAAPSRARQPRPWSRCPGRIPDGPRAAASAQRRRRGRPAARSPMPLARPVDGGRPSRGPSQSNHRQGPRRPPVTSAGHLHDQPWPVAVAGRMAYSCALGRWLRSYHRRPGRELAGQGRWRARAGRGAASVPRVQRYPLPGGSSGVTSTLDRSSVSSRLADPVRWNTASQRGPDSWSSTAARVRNETSHAGRDDRTVSWR